MIEWFLFFISVSSFILLTHVHFTLVVSPSDGATKLCPCFNESNIGPEWFFVPSSYHHSSASSSSVGSDDDDDGNNNNTKSAAGVLRIEILSSPPPPPSSSSSSVMMTSHDGDESDNNNLLLDDEENQEQQQQHGKNYAVEYALEYGVLRLSPASRARLGVPVRTVVLDPGSGNDPHQCFGRHPVLMRHLLGTDSYHDLILMSCLKSLAESRVHHHHHPPGHHHNNSSSSSSGRGFVKNVATGQHFRFVSTTSGGSSSSVLEEYLNLVHSFITSFVLMVIFTLIVSMLLRFSHHQVFLFVSHLMHLLHHHHHHRINNNNNIPTTTTTTTTSSTSSVMTCLAPLITVILALVGIEAIICEFFEDTTTAFWIIIMIWEADQFDVLCCHSSVSKRHWLKFFFLYHYFFYGNYLSLSIIIIIIIAL